MGEFLIRRMGDRKQLKDERKKNEGGGGGGGNKISAAGGNCAE